MKTIHVVHSHPSLMHVMAYLDKTDCISTYTERCEINIIIIITTITKLFFFTAVNHTAVNYTAVNYTAVDCTAVNYTAAVDYTSLASIATSTIIGITIGVSFVVFFSLGVLLATGIGCVMKARSKDTPDQQKMVYDEIGPHRGAIEMETNSAYLSMTGRV